MNHFTSTILCLERDGERNVVVDPSSQEQIGAACHFFRSQSILLLFATMVIRSDVFLPPLIINSKILLLILSTIVDVQQTVHTLILLVNTTLSTSVFLLVVDHSFFNC